MSDFVADFLWKVSLKILKSGINLKPLTPVAGIILAQNDDGPIKWTNGPYPNQISKF